MSIADRIRDALENKGINMAELSRRSGVPQGRLSQIASGKTKNPRGDTISKLAKCLDVSEGWLLTGEGPMRGGHGPTNETQAAGRINDVNTLRAVIEAVEEYLQSERRNLAPSKKAELIITLYEMFAEEEEGQVDKGTVVKLIRLAS